jgi:hypothetical protein
LFVYRIVLVQATDMILPSVHLTLMWSVKYYKNQTFSFCYRFNFSITLMWSITIFRDLCYESYCIRISKRTLTCADAKLLAVLRKASYRCKTPCYRHNNKASCQTYFIGMQTNVNAFHPRKGIVMTINRLRA